MCPMFDHNEIPMAVCEEQSMVCECRSFPDSGIYEAIHYYPQSEGNVTRCVAAWSTAPLVHTAVAFVTAGLALYTTAYFFYISVLSRICCCAPRGCTKVNAAALCFGAALLFYSMMPIWLIVAQGETPIGLGYGLTGLSICTQFCSSLAMPLFYTSVCDVAYAGEGKAIRRCRIKIVLWCLYLSHLFIFLVSATMQSLSAISADMGRGIFYAGVFFEFVLLVSVDGFMVIAHKAMYEVSRQLDFVMCASFP